MRHIPVAPFKRQMTRAELAGRHTEELRAKASQTPVIVIDKWMLFRELGVARKAFGLSDRELSVLQALLTFLPGKTLGDGDMVVFPSNKTLGDRLHGMPCPTLRRHLAKLVSAGLLIRRDSPNGKRYSRGTASGRVAFGFDLSPLPRRRAEICEAADAARTEAKLQSDLRETARLLRRDLLAIYRAEGETCDRIDDLLRLTGRDLRRTLDLQALSGIVDDLQVGLEEARGRLLETEDLSINDAQNEHHLQTQKKEILESEKAREIGSQSHASPQSNNDNDKKPRLTLSQLQAACPELAAFHGQPFQSWEEVSTIAEVLRPGMGVPDDAWREAVRWIGRVGAAIVLGAMLERLGDLRCPGAYLRSLTLRARNGNFSPEPMIQALLNRTEVA